MEQWSNDTLKIMQDIYSVFEIFLFSIATRLFSASPNTFRAPYNCNGVLFFVVTSEISKLHLVYTATGCLRISGLVLSEGSR